MPTEAEWEFAARGGTLSKGYTYAGGNDLKEVGWFLENSVRQTRPIGQKKANELGIHDMSGNVWEWCANWYEAYRDIKQLIYNPTGPATGSYRVRRGGSCRSASTHCRVSSRDYWGSDDWRLNLGFRLARTY